MILIKELLGETQCVYLTNDFQRCFGVWDPTLAESRSHIQQWLQRQSSLHPWFHVVRCSNQIQLPHDGEMLQNIFNKVLWECIARSNASQGCSWMQLTRWNARIWQRFHFQLSNCLLCPFELACRKAQWQPDLCNFEGKVDICCQILGVCHKLLRPDTSLIPRKSRHMLNNIRCNMSSISHLWDVVAVANIDLSGQTKHRVLGLQLLQIYSNQFPWLQFDPAKYPKFSRTSISNTWGADGPPMPRKCTGTPDSRNALLRQNEQGITKQGTWPIQNQNSTCHASHLTAKREMFSNDYKSEVSLASSLCIDQESPHACPAHGACQALNPASSE